MSSPTPPNVGRGENVPVGTQMVMNGLDAIYNAPATAAMVPDAISATNHQNDAWKATLAALAIGGTMALREVLPVNPPQYPATQPIAENLPANRR